MFPTVDKKKTGIRLRRVMDEKGYTVKDIQSYLGLASVQSVYHWLNGISMPTIDNLYALSELFQIPIDGLVCGNRRYIPAEKESQQYNRLRAYCHRLHENRAA